MQSVTDDRPSTRKVVQVTLTGPLYDKLKLQGERDDRSLSEEIVTLLYLGLTVRDFPDYLERHSRAAWRVALDAPDSQDLVPAGSPVGELPTQMQDAWIAFARTGNPETPALAGWQPYTAARRTTMRLGPTCGPIEAPFEAERRLWDARAPAGSAPA
jgi:hypothetical protein